MKGGLYMNKSNKELATELTVAYINLLSTVSATNIDNTLVATVKFYEEMLGILNKNN
jgi:hypothetical protein